VIVTVNGSDVKLSQKDFLASGGEGDIYVKGASAYKIYHDKNKTIPSGKFAALASLTSPLVVGPRALAFSGSEPVGYQMPFIRDTSALCQLFTQTFKQRNGVSPTDCLELARGMAETLKSVHSSGVLVVDLNELNCLADDGFKRVYFIDVDSWQAPGYPATAIMESVRDYHTKGFDEGSDWFSFAVVTFQMLIGIQSSLCRPGTGRGTRAC
jgi:DNA-binding helix-hairpin-helix protein with protein kinase domain